VSKLKGNHSEEVFYVSQQRNGGSMVLRPHHRGNCQYLSSKLVQRGMSSIYVLSNRTDRYFLPSLIKIFIDFNHS